MKRRLTLILLPIAATIVIALTSIAIIAPPWNLKQQAGVRANTTPRATAIPTIQSTSTIWTDPLTAARAAFTPIQLIVPRMSLSANVIPEGATSTGAMATPKCQSATDPLCSEVYWWSAGAVPGEKGNVVIAGHVNRPDASPASFGNLDVMQVGDEAQVKVANGITLLYVVTKVERVSAYVQGGNNPVINAIFGPDITPNLNLITCIGDWDGATFNQRLVVHMQLAGVSPFPNQ